MIKNIPIFGKIVKDFDEDIKKYGLQQATKNLVKRHHGKLRIGQLSKNTAYVLQNKPVIVVGNHPFEIETYAIFASLPKRDDIYLIMSANFVGFLPHLDKHLIPVFVNHHAVREKASKFSGRVANFIGRTMKFPEKQARLKNKESIEHAANKINKGGLVILFPEGFRGKGGKWFSGIGHLIKKVGHNNDAYVVKAYVHGTSDLDYLRLIPIINRFLPIVSVYYSEPQKITDILKKDSEAKIIKDKLETEYNNWIKKLV